MKSILFASLAGISLAAPVLAEEGTLARAERLLRDPTASGVLVASHRACWASASENSLDGIEHCIAEGIDIIEIDVRATADGRMVLMHDATVDRTTNGKGKLSELSYKDVRKLRLRSRQGGDRAQVTRRRVPTLEEALAAAKGRVVINMDAKDPLHDQIFAAVERAGMLDQVIMKMQSAPDAPELAQSRFARRALFMPVIFACTGRMQIGRFCTDQPENLLPRYSRYDPVGYELNFEDPAFTSRLHAGGAPPVGRLWVNSLKPAQAGGVSDADALNDPEGVWGTLIAQGFTMIQTDHPEALLSYLRTRGLHP